MAKQKDLGDILEIHYDPTRDSLPKFQKILRKVIGSERKNLWIDMRSAPLLPRDYLSPLVLGAKALKAYNRTITLVLSELNHSLLQNTIEAPHFLFEVVAGGVPPAPEVEIESETQEPESPAPSLQIPEHPGFTVQDHWICISDQGLEIAPQHLPKLTAILLKHYDHIVIDVTGLFFVTPPIIQTLILETINSGNAITVRIPESMVEMLQSNPQYIMLNLDVVSESETPDTTETSESVGAENAATEMSPIEEDYPTATEATPDKSAPVSAASLATPALVEDAAILGSSDASGKSLLGTPGPYNTDQEVTDTRLQDSITRSTMAMMKPTLGIEEDNTPSAFKLEVNCLYASEMTKGAFLRDFHKYLSRLPSCGELAFIDLSKYRRMEKEVAKVLVEGFWWAQDQRCKIVLKLLKDQQQTFMQFWPTIEEVKVDEKKPEFVLCGSRLELHNITANLFVEQFPEECKKLQETGLSNLVVDLTQLPEVNDNVMEILIRSYLDAMGKNLGFTVRILAEMEPKFQKSSRGRSLPLEIMRGDAVRSAVPTGQQPKIDMNKIMDAMGKDRLTQKVLDKQFDTVHIESRGSFQNWEPSPTKADERKTVYTGSERRLEKRYDVKDIEVIFARGSIAKIAGRRYPVHNLSQSGICFTSAILLSRNEPLRIKMFREDVVIEVTARVIWVHPVPAQALFRIGVQFNKVSEVATAQIRDLIRKIYQHG